VAIREVGTASNTAVNGADCAIDLTAITGLAEGDLVIAAFVVADTVDRDMMTTDANTWTEITDLYANDTEDCNLGVFYRYMTSSVDTTVTGKGYASASAGVAGVARAFRGVASAADGGPFSATTTTATGTDGALADPPSITHAHDGAVIVIVAGAAQATSSAYTIAAGTMFASNLTTRTVAETFDASIAMTHGPPTGASTDHAAFGNANSAATNSWCAATIALKPSLPLGIHLVGGGAGFNNNGSDVVITLSNMREGDLVIGTYAIGSTAGDFDMSVSGYTEVADLFGNDTIDVNFGVFYKYMTSTPDASITFVGNANASDGVAGTVHVYRGVKSAAQGGPWDTTPTTSNTLSTTFPNPPSIDWTGLPGRVAVIAGGGSSQTNSGLYVRPASYVDFATSIGNDTNDGHSGIGTNYAPADPEDPDIFTGNAALVDNVAYASCACTMMLAPNPGYINVIVTGA
jgi:hypothetical protein